MTTDTNVINIRQARADALVGEEWVDSDGHTWYVRNTAEEGGDYKLRIVRKGTGVGRWQTIEQVEEYLAANRAKAEEPNAIGYMLIVHEASKECRRLFADVVPAGWIEVEREEGDEEYPEYDPEEFETVTVDPELAAAGYEADEKLRQDQLQKEPRKYELPQSVIKTFVGRVQELLEAVFEHEGPGYATLKLSAKPGETSREAILKYEIDLKVPKLKADGYFFAGDEIIPGVPNRQPENQLTINDATEQAVDGDNTPEGAFEEVYGHGETDGDEEAEVAS